MKKAISLVMCLLLLLSLCACGMPKEVKEAEKAIKAIGAVTIDSKAAIETARKKYDALDTGLKYKVTNYATLEKAEKDYELVDYKENYQINYSDISEHNLANILDYDVNEWYNKSINNGALFVCLWIAANADARTLKFDDLQNQFITIKGEDKRLDIYCSYGTDEIIGFQYWPEKEIAKFGSVETKMDTTDYVDMLVRLKIVDSYTRISSSDIVAAATTINSAING